MRHFFLIVFTLFFSISSLIAQSDKKVEATIELFKEDPEKAIQKLRKLIDKEGKDARINAWELLIEMYEEQYKFASSDQNPERKKLQQYYSFLNFKRDSLLEIDESLRSEQDEMMLSELEVEILSTKEKNYALMEKAYESFVAVCREATLRSEATKGDMHLRELFLPTNPDTFAVNEQELSMYNDINRLMEQGGFSSARILLDDLKQKYPESYSLNLSYYYWYSYQKKMDSAKMVLEKLILLYPEVISTRESLARQLYNQGDYYGAKKQVHEMLIRYPGHDVKNYYSEVLAVENKVFDDKRIYRNFEPNRIATVQSVVPDEWKAYRKAKVEFSDQCNDMGISQKVENGDTIYDYMELYSWRKLLEAHRDDKPDFLSFAYKMEKEGYLDCYVMLSMFHFDFHEQYAHWARGKKERILKYIDNYLVSYSEELKKDG